jgi:hypothetical protein
MTASWTVAEGPRAHSLAVGATPEAIHSALDAEDQVRFREAFDEALEATKHAMDLQPLVAVLEEYRRLAVLQTDRAGWRRTLRAAAYLATEEQSPEDEPLTVTRAKAGM